MTPSTFLFLTFLYQLILSGRDFVVTGILAKGLPADWRFHTYAIVTTLEVSVLAVFAFLTEPVFWVGILKLWTIYLCWIGGALDWIYFTIRKLYSNTELPSWDFVWFWMPKIFVTITHGKITLSHPTSKHWLVYTLVMWVPNLLIWTFLLKGMI